MLCLVRRVVDEAMTILLLQSKLGKRVQMRVENVKMAQYLW